MKSTSRMASALLLTAFLAVGLGASPQYPSRLITFVVPGAPGSGTDIIGRALVEAAQPFLPVRAVVINKPGASGTIGFAEVVGAKPDGSTIGMFAVAMATVQPHLSKLPYNTP
ncbi:MAG: tripartite tricarboxylate transporter substrate-binding protein, partial [Armatimonadota bacterium]|nr:tripartite tricarboxylate transporter substrate-binding protein [Armatimonadota bacterium]